MLWMLVGCALIVFYVFLWSLMFTASDADDRAMREWDRQQAEWRRDDR